MTTTGSSPSLPYRIAVAVSEVLQISLSAFTPASPGPTLTIRNSCASEMAAENMNVSTGSISPFLLIREPHTVTDLLGNRVFSGQAFHHTKLTNSVGYRGGARSLK